MNLPTIVEFPNAALTSVSAPVERFDQTLKQLVSDMFEVLDALDEGSGIGLSAPQLGVNQRVSVVRIPGDEFGPMVYVNPVLRARSAFGLVQESCLSVPETSGNVIRATQVTVAAWDADGKQFTKEVTGMHAVCLQHEIDHLDGKLFIDRLFWLRRWRIRNRLQRRHDAAETSGT